MYRMPRSSSMVKNDHVLAPLTLRHEPSSQVSLPNSPGCGTVWNVHTRSPVRRSQARTSPAGPFEPVSSALWTPVNTRCFQTATPDEIP